MSCKYIGDEVGLNTCLTKFGNWKKETQTKVPVRNKKLAKRRKVESKKKMETVKKIGN